METFIVILVVFLMISTFGFKLWLSILNYNNRTAPIPKIVADVYEKDEYEKWLKYSMENYRFSLVESVFGVFLSLVLLLSGLFLVFKDISEGISSNLAVQTLIFMGIYFLVSFFFDIFSYSFQNFICQHSSYYACNSP